MAVIIFELAPITLAPKFESVFCEYFDSTKYELISEDALDILRTSLLGKNNVTGAELENVFSDIQQKAGLNEDVAKGPIGDYVQYSDDWVSTKTSLSVTSISVLVVVLNGLAAGMANWSSFLLVTVVGVVVVGAAILGGNRMVDKQFQKIGPHRYTRDVENGRLLIPRYRIFLNGFVILVIIFSDLCLL